MATGYSCYKGFHGVTRGYKGFQEVVRGYKRLPVVIQEVEKG